MSSIDENSSRTASIIEESRRLAARGDLDAAIDFLERTIHDAKGVGDRDLADMAICTRGGLLIATNRAEAAVAELRQILLRTSSKANGFRAAIHISHYHDQHAQSERSLFYARLALDHAVSTDHGEFISSAHNRIGNLLLLDSRFADAAASYEHAIDLRPSEPSLETALIHSNLGYCRAVLGDLDAAFSILFKAMRMTRRCGNRIWERYPRLGLSYAYLERDRPDRARSHAATALVLASEADSTIQIKNALYLLGESEKQLGDEAAALEAFFQLQETFYPDEPGIVDILIATDIRQLVNLMA